jgi:hypothetical protein
MLCIHERPKKKIKSHVSNANGLTAGGLFIGNNEEKSAEAVVCMEWAIQKGRTLNSSQMELGVTVY